MGVFVPNESGIYKIENTINNKVYVGSSSNMRKRRSGHMSGLRNDRHHSTHLQYSFNKYGEDYFKFHVLEVCDIKDLEEVEHYWIKKLKANKNEFGYNARVHVASNRGFKHSEETKLKISRNRKGKTPKCYHISKEMRELKSQMCKAQNPQQYHTKETEKKRLANLRKAIKGKPISEGHKTAIGEANQGSGNGMAKLTEDEVIDIKVMLRDKPKATQAYIADQFNVSRRLIGMIKAGERWGHIMI